MGVQEEQERRRELLLRVLEVCPDPAQALDLAVRMEQFIIDGQTSREKPHEATQPGGAAVFGRVPQNMQSITLDGR